MQELLTLVKMQPQFEERNAVIIGLSVDPGKPLPRLLLLLSSSSSSSFIFVLPRHAAKTHAEWVKSIQDADTKVNFPIIGDLDGKIARRVRGRWQRDDPRRCFANACVVPHHCVSST